MRPLPTDRSRLSMAGPDHGLIRQGPELLADALQECRMIPSGHVCTPDPLPEKHIPADQEVLGLAIKSDAARRMSRQEQDLQLVLPPFHYSAYLKKDQGP